MTSFGERVDLTANLASILRRYPFGIGLFREVIQNSDDARATKQIFVLDHRQHASVTLIHPTMSILQGPALLAYNDTTFSDADWEAIRTVSQSSKTTDTERIGKHGLGSRAYYHLTDNPQYLSGGYLVTFDPHRWIFEDGGWRETLQDVSSSYSDQLAPFSAITGQAPEQYFPGTIVRLPLRSASANSRISSDRLDVSKIRTLLVDFAQTELQMVMLFLTHLSSIEIREIDRHGRVTVLATATAISRPCGAPVHSDPSAMFGLESREISVTYHSTVRSASPDSREWVIIRTSFPIDECVERLSTVFPNDSERVQRELTREKLRPDIALAFPKSASRSLIGRLFTFLPLPLETGFPCHIHGIFSLTDSRQNLRNPTETILAETADALAVAWNALLFATFIPRAWLVLLESVAAGSIPLSMYDIFPPTQIRNASGDAKYWSSLLHNLIDLALARDASIWPQLSFAAPVDCTSLSTALVASTHDDEDQLRALIKGGVVIILPPAHIRLVLLECEPQYELKPGTVRATLVASASLAKLQRAEYNRIIEFLLQSHELQHLMDVPIIPLVTGSTAALVAKRNAPVEHVLMTAEDEELFGQFGPTAVALQHLPPVAQRLLINQGSNCLNVVSLDCAKATEYMRAVCQHFSTARPYTSSWLKFRKIWDWTQACQWLGVFWEWIATCPFSQKLLTETKSLPLLPTTAKELRAVGESIVFYPREMDESSHQVLCRLGVSFLHSSIPLGFFQQHRPALLKSATSASDLLLVLQSTPPALFDENSARVLRAYLPNCFTMSSRLTVAQKTILRDLPIHPVVTYDPDSNSVQVRSSSLPCLPIYCLADPSSLSLPLPHLPSAHFVHRTDDEQRLLEQIDYQTSVNTITDRQLLRLHVEHIEQQSPSVRLHVLTFLVKNPGYRTSETMDRLRTSRIVPVGVGDRLLPPQDVIDPWSSISSLVPPGDPNVICDVNSETSKALMRLGLLRSELDPKFVEDRICFISSLPSTDEALASDAAKRLLRVLDSDTSGFNCSKVQYDAQLAWIPTKAGLKRPQDTRDVSNSMLCDRVMHMLDIPTAIESKSLRRMLRWDQPIPCDIVIEQLRRLVPESQAPPKYIVKLTLELGRRFQELSPAHLEELIFLLYDVPCVLTDGNTLHEPRFSVFRLVPRIRGFGQISHELVQSATAMGSFLRSIGCTDTPSNDAILQQLELLTQNSESMTTPAQAKDTVSACIDLLSSLDFDSLTEEECSSLVVPANDNSLRGVKELFYNDLGARAYQFEIPENRARVHQKVEISTLLGKLQIPSLGSLHCKPLSFVAEDMREDLTTRVANVLRSYAIGQAFNEFLANAADAGATSFDLMLDDAQARQVKEPSDELLCGGIAQFCRGTSLIVHNDALFMEDDIHGICRIGRGGQEGHIDSIGRFGLGALSFYHFSEVAMILSGKYLMLLDPSGRFLPESLNKNSWVATLDQVRSLYPKQLQVFSGLFGFQIDDAEYQGTIIRLPLRTAKQASKSNLSKVPLEPWNLREMLEGHKILAAQSLLFISVNCISASISGSSLWTVFANREEDTSRNEPYSVQHVDITVSGNRLLPRKTSWTTFVHVIPSASYPPWVPEILVKHRIKQVRISLASEHGKDSDTSEAKTHRATQKVFFASLPLPIMTTLPVHIDASFVLADDRRNIRWDGDGTLNRDSEFNHWLLSSMVPPLYLFLLEVWQVSLPKSLAPWPGYANQPPDTFSRTVVEGFYSDCLSQSTRPVFRTITGRCIIPSSAVLRSTSDPPAIKIVLQLLRPDDLVKLPPDVRSRVLNLPGMRRVDSAYISTVIKQKRQQFVEAYSSEKIDVRDLDNIIRYLLHLDGSLTAITAGSASNVLAGLPLIPLADGSLAQAEGEAAPVVFAGPWMHPSHISEGTHYPWPIFPARRFLHPSFDQELLLGKDLTRVKRLDGSDVVSLLRDVFVPAPRREVTEAERAWVLSFWSLYARLPHKPELDQLSDLPLIPTMNKLTFVSLDTAVALPTIGHPDATATDQDCSIITPLQNLGAEFVLERLQVRSSRNTAAHLALPFEVRRYLSVVTFTFKRVLAIFQHFFDMYGQDFVHRKFDALDDGEWEQLASWVRRKLGTWQDGYSNAEVDVVRRLPIWTAYPSVSGSPTLLSLTDTFVRILPIGIPLTQVIPFLGKVPSLHFVEYSAEMAKLVSINAQAMSFDDFVSHLKFPSYFRNAENVRRYRSLLECLLRFPSRGSVPGLVVPNEGLELVDISTVYKSDVPEFQAAFAHRLHQNFVHSLLRTYEDRMVALGLRGALDCSSFLACVQAMDEDFDKESVEDFERSRVIFAWYSTQLPLKAEGNDAWWRRLDAYSFIPRHASRRIGSATAFEASDFSMTLPRIVPPNRILLHEHSSVSWTQRALFPEQSSAIRRLVMADESIGVPTVEEVVKHLCVLALRIAPRYPRDSGLLEDLQATYKFLNDQHQAAAPYLIRQRREKLFLNVNDPTRDGWHFCAASLIMFNVPDEDGREDVRAFLRPFRNLLCAGGAEEIKVPKAPVLIQSPAEDELARMRGSLDSLRQSKILTDVVFTVKEPSEDTTEVHAHRVILSTASEHFRTMFCSHLAESGPASAEHPIPIRLQDDLELHCAGLIIDYVYTGHFAQNQERDCLLKLMQLAHRWEMADIQREAEVLLIPTITPGTFLELRDYAKEVGATLLLEKIDEFQRENASALEEMIEWP